VPSTASATGAVSLLPIGTVVVFSVGVPGNWTWKFPSSLR